MIQAKLDQINTLTLKESNGTLQGVVRVAVVTGLEASSDYSVLLAAINASGVPVFGDHLDDNPSHQAYGLVVIDRDVKMLDKGSAEVTITYGNAFDTDSLEDLYDDPYLGIITGEVRCTIQQKSSNIDAEGNQIVLSHTYPPDDNNFPGQTREQGGEITYFSAQRSFSVHGIKATNTPWAIANAIIGRVNFFPFSGEAARTWMCIGCDWKLQGNRDGFARYYMRFEFQFDPDTYDPTVVYIDDITGKPPAGLVFGQGIKTIAKHQGVNFEGIIGTLIHGA